MNLLNQRCKIERSVVTKNQYMQTTKVWTLIGEEIRCNIQFDRVSDVNYKVGATGINTLGNYVGFFEPTQSLVKGDRITWTGMTLFVKGNPFPVYAGLNKVHHLEALLGVEET